ncbi:hypothetical protein ABZP36_014075 [Zizania latifolia]
MRDVVVGWCRSQEPELGRGRRYGGRGQRGCRKPREPAGKWEREDGSGVGSDGEHQWKKWSAREEAALQQRRTASRRSGDEESRPDSDSVAASLCGSEWWRRRRRYVSYAEEARRGRKRRAGERSHDDKTPVGISR